VFKFAYGALVGAAMSLVVPSSADAQEVVAASGDEAAEAAITPLPPIIVESPKEQITRKPKRVTKGGEATAGGASPAEEGAESATGEPGGVFTLGKLDLVGGTVVTGEAMWTFSKDTLPSALALAPGVNASNSGGSRNEQLIFVRGFDRFQVPLSIDGIRVYLPADNRIDFGRFLTPDISEMQIAKGYTSVLNGPGGIGGAINLVTKKPTEAVEAEVQGGLNFGTDGSYEGYKTYGSVGTRQAGYYLQASGTLLDLDGWMLSEDFAPTANEDGGLRDRSDTRDWQVNLKAGLTPNATDDYSINYIKQSGSKGAPLHITDSITAQRNWDWPYWDLESVYWLSHTKIGDASYLETKVYFNALNNALFAYDDATYSSQAKPRAFRSYYDDWAAGLSVQAGTELSKWDTLKGALYYRRDNHAETQDYNVSGVSCSSPPCLTEPEQVTIEDTYSVALENTVHVSTRFDLVGGASYNWRHLLQAEDFSTQSGFAGMVYYPTTDSDAFDWQGAAIYRLTDDQTVHASVSARTRFPTIFERFSSRFGGATSNPDLQSERATNYEIGWSEKFAPGSQLAAAVFYNDVTDVIESIPIVYNGQNLTQSQNVGDGHFYGVELSGDRAVTRSLLVGGNITWMRRYITNPSNPDYELTGVPEIKGIAYMTYRITDQLSLTPNVEFASKRWTVTSDGSVYYKTGAFGLVNLEAEYDLDEHTAFAVTGRNLLDADYQLTDGFPEPGRSFVANVKATF
jgi:iron complex outermembrane recepter protein